MSSGEFALLLQQSVQTHLESIQQLADEAKARVTAGVSGLRPSVEQAAAPAAQQPRPFDDDPAFMAASLEFDRAPATPRPAVSFDDLLDGAGMDDDGVPVWEDPP